MPKVVLHEMTSRITGQDETWPQLPVMTRSEDWGEERDRTVGIDRRYVLRSTGNLGPGMEHHMLDVSDEPFGLNQMIVQHEFMLMLMGDVVLVRKGSYDANPALDETASQETVRGL